MQTILEDSIHKMINENEENNDSVHQINDQNSHGYLTIIKADLVLH